MLETIAVALVILWLPGLVSSYTMDGFIHALPVSAIVVILIRVIQGRRLHRRGAGSRAPRPAATAGVFFWRQ